MTDWKSVLAVAAGGAIGAVARFTTALLVTERLGSTGFPYSTLFINVTGSFFIGLVASLAGSGLFSGNATLRNFIAPGILGGFTTFSTFSIETLELTRAAPLLAVLYVSLSVAAGVGAAYAGFMLGQTVPQP